MPYSLRHRLAIFFAGLFPQIQLVALCNSRAMGEADDNSDIDLFIITQRGRLWTGRFLVTIISSLLGVRRKNTHGLTKGSPKYIKKTKEKFCLSFFITEEAMNLDPFRIDNDVYLDRWIRTLVPLVNKNNALERFWSANGAGELPRQEEKQKFLHFVFCPLYFVFSMFEYLIKSFWLPKTLKTYERLGKPWGVVISDTMLKFHDNDQRIAYRDLQK